MNEEFVPFELAKKLKEKGYTKETSHNYDELGRICVSLVGEEYPYPCPQIHQVLKWLREKGIFIEIHVHATFATKNKVAYWCRICCNSNGMRIKQIDEIEASYADYEKAAMGGIEYCLDNLI